MDYSGVGYLWIILMLLSAVWILILTAPVHYGWSIGEKVTQCYISPNLHLYRGWTEGEDIFHKLSIFGWAMEVKSLKTCHSLPYLVPVHQKFYCMFTQMNCINEDTTGLYIWTWKITSIFSGWKDHYSWVWRTELKIETRKRRFQRS